MKLERSPETEALYRLLESMAPGQEMLFGALSEALKFDVTAFLGNLYRVRDALKRRGVAVIEVVPKTGIRRLTDTEAINHYGPGQMRRMARAARRALGGTQSVNYATLTPADQTRHNTTLARLGAIGLFSSGHRSEKKIAESPRPVFSDVGATLALFSKK